MGSIHKKVVITKDCQDYLRITPFGNQENKAEIKFSFLDKNFIIRRFVLNENKGGLLYKHSDFGLATNELTYHNSNSVNPKPAILTKDKDNPKRVPVLQEIIELDLKNLILPIPICRITINKESNIAYKAKKYHNNIELNSKYNTTEIYISSAKYDIDLLSKRFPLIVNFLFPIVTIDFLIYGAGFSLEPMMNRMSENKEPIKSLQSDLIGKYRIYYKTYELIKTEDGFMSHLNKEYSQNNFIEFFNNIDYLDLLATTSIGYRIDGSKRHDCKPAYRRDLENLKKMRFHKDYIKRWSNRFYRKEIEYKKLKIFRSGIIFP